MKDFILELTVEEAFKYGSITASGLAGLYLGFKRIFSKKNKKRRLCDKCGLCKHKLYVMLEIWIREVEHKNWKCCNDYKTAVAKDMIRIKLQTGIDFLKTSFCHLQHMETKTDIESGFNNSIESMIALYNNRWQEAGINPIIISKVNSYHNTNVKYALRLAKLEMDRDYVNIREMLRNILNSLIVPYTMFILDVRNILDDMNGNLKDDVYKGIKNDNVCLNINIEKGRMSFIED